MMKRHWFSRFGRQSDGAKSRPWLLLWLVPLLALSFSSSGPHEHDWNAGRALTVHSESASGAGQQDGPETSSAAAKHSQALLSQTPSPSSEADCLACQWLAAATAYQAPSALAIDARPVAVPFFAFASVSSFASPRNASVRGPPLS